MTKNEILKILLQLKNENKIYHSIIFSCNNQDLLEDLANEFIRIIFCVNDSLKNDNCKSCNKVINNLTFNILRIGDGTESIKKEKILELITVFSSSSISGEEKKVYKISNAENLADTSANSLLKFLEEPPKNTFALLLTKDRNQILQTIKSRCKVFVLDYERKEILKNSIMEELITNKKRDDLLIYSYEFKKLEKKEQVNILESVFQNIIIKKHTQLATLFLDTILELKKSSYSSLLIENLFIKIYEVL
ncbi:hypothetical protein [Spiroplasma tabanidicola]|uniref:DNA polymerase III subunit delta n=1 Tax=Spiroplasma tabanidicola TaxID=324079 RepID=A0A6I6C3J7_9MOLU|nr:hypothetical protein [Spiroplasma tabanidicola]QGS51377.1 DNA polymerase III subunit delta [Spiroplasma tabanidicola]